MIGDEALVRAINEAAGPSREIDARIYCRTKGWVFRSCKVQTYDVGFPKLIEIDTADGLVHGHLAPEYTRSLDLAMLLVPKGDWLLKTCSCEGVTTFVAEVEGPFSAGGKTPAIAVCGAAVRALVHK